MMATVDELLARPFSDRPLVEQIRIIMGGRPQPELRAFIPDEHGTLELFNKSIYEEETWLCGCDKMYTFLCWICLLFTSDSRQWNIPRRILRDKQSGFFAYPSLREDMKFHRYSENHLNGMLQYRVFLKDNIRKTTADIAEQNPRRQKLNREALERLIDIVCTLLQQASPRAVETMVAELTEKCVEMLKFLKPYDDPDVIRKATSILETNPSIVLDIVVLMAAIMKKEIVKELKFSTFVSVILSGHRDAKQQKKYSIVVRYVKDGEVHERLVGFSPLDERSLIRVLTQLIAELEISDKFLAFSCDGLVASAKSLHDFVYFLNDHYPKTFFVPWHGHEFHSVLLQSAAAQPGVDVFLSTLKSMKEYFESSPAKSKAFHESCHGEVFDLSRLKMTDYQFLRVLKMYRKHFVKFFGYLADGRCASDVFVAEDYAKKLQDPYFAFTLEIFFQLFEHTAYFNEMLTSNSPDCVFESFASTAILDVLKKKKERGYKELWEPFKAEISNSDSKKNQTLVTKKETKLNLFKIFQGIITNLMAAIQLRVQHVKKLNFLGIFDCENLQKFDMTRHYIKNLLFSQIPLFSCSELVEEVRVLDNYGRLLGGKSVFETVELFRQKKLDEIFKNCYKVAELVATLPCKPIYSDNPITKLDSINSWVSSSFSHQAECLSLLYIENDFLKYLKSQIKFNDLVILELDALSNFIGENGKTNSTTIK